MSDSFIYSHGVLQPFKALMVPPPGLEEFEADQKLSGGNYAKSAWAYACMQIRGNALAQIPWRITRNGDIVENHTLLTLLRDVNDEINWSDLILATEIDLLLKGAAYWHFDSTRIMRLNPNTMKVKASKKGIGGFVQTLEGKEKLFKREEIVYFREFHPVDDLGPGIPPIEICKLSIMIEAECNRYLGAFFKNSAIPALLMHSPQEVPIGELRRLEALWAEEHQGTENTHKTGWLNKGFEAQLLSSELGKMALEEVRDQARRDICTAFKVPMVLVGDLDSANYATAREARMGLYEDTILHRADYLANIINASLVQRIDPNVVFEFGVDELSILQENKDNKAIRLLGLYNSGIIKAEFVLSELGYPPEALQSMPTATESPVIKSWNKKALKALKNGNSADVPFETDEIPIYVQSVIKARLVEAKTPADVNKAFV